MICQSCAEFSFFDYLEHYFTSSYLYKPNDYFSAFVTENKIDGFICKSCGTSLLLGDLYFDTKDDLDNAKEAVFVEIANVVMQNIEACEQCSHGHLMDDIQHSIEETFDDEDENSEEIFEEFDSRTELKDLIWEITEFDEDYFDSIVAHIECPHCNNGSGPDYDEKIDYGKFDLYTDVFTKKDIMYFNNKFYGDPYEEIRKEISRIADICTYVELVKLKEDFINNTLLIAEHPVFKRIYSIVKNLFDNNVSLTLYKSKRLFRARLNELANTILSSNKMWEPPIEKARQNRYNMSGIPVLYCSNSREILFKEVQDKDKMGYTFATLRVLNPLKLFKILPAFGYEFKGFIEEPVPTNCEKNEFKVQYIITNILASVAKYIGFDGIVYLSIHDNQFLNYAIFDYKKNVDLEIIDINLI